MPRTCSYLPTVPNERPRNAGRISEMRTSLTPALDAARVWPTSTVAGVTPTMAGLGAAATGLDVPATAVPTTIASHDQQPGSAAR